MPQVRIGWDAGPGGFELCPKAYCAVAHGKRGLRQLRYAAGEVGGRAHPRLPAIFTRRLVERRERLRALSVEHGQDGR